MSLEAVFLAMEVRISAHTAYRLQYHVVWVCKYCRKVLNSGVRMYLYKVLLGLLRSMPGVEIEWFSKVYWKENIVWSPGYFVSSVGIDEEIIKKYVEYQGHQDSGQLRQEL